MIISIIFAMNAARIIGNGSELPWHLPSDLKRFKELTTGKPVIMGRKTFESILTRNGKPLQNRKNIVVTRNSAHWAIRKESGDAIFRDCIFVPTIQEAIAQASTDAEVFVIGGAEIYAQALPIASRLYFTQVGGKFEGDIKFPQFNMHEWETVHDELVITDNHPYAFSVLERINRIAPSETASGENLVNPTFAKGDGYGAAIAEIQRDGMCPFCPETLLWHPWPILSRIGNWIITRSGWPYENAEYHFLLIGDRHITATTQMTLGDNEAVRLLTQWAVNRFSLVGYGLPSRSGDTNYTGATVQHLHFHLIQPKLGPDGKALTVWFPIG